jgi:hypothetical protein
MSVTPVMLADEDSRMIGHKCRHKANRHVVERLRYTFKQPHFSFEFMFCSARSSYSAGHAAATVMTRCRTRTSRSDCQMRDQFAWRRSREGNDLPITGGDALRVA